MRAYKLLKEVEDKTEELRQHASQHEARLSQDEPFLTGLMGAFQGSRKLGGEKAAVNSDLSLAEKEIEKALALDAQATIETADGDFRGEHLRASVLSMRGMLEVVWGSAASARDHLTQSLTTLETPQTHYWLGLVQESLYQPEQALMHFEKCLELDPDGEFSVAALRSAGEMRNYKKRFRGSWELFGCFFLLFFPAAIVYFFVKRK